MKGSNEYERYVELHDMVVRECLEGMYSSDYRRGWKITALIRMPDDKWLVKWSKDPFATGSMEKSK
jgi:hypothetical protein